MRYYNFKLMDYGVTLYSEEDFLKEKERLNKDFINIIMILFQLSYINRQFITFIRF